MPRLGRIPETIRRHEFARHFVEKGFNATRAYKAISPLVTEKSAGVEGSNYLADPRVQQRILELLPTDDAESKIFTEAYNAKRKRNIEWKDLHKYMETSLKLKGYLNQDQTKPSVNIGLVIDNT